MQQNVANDTFGSQNAWILFHARERNPLEQSISRGFLFRRYEAGFDQKIKNLKMLCIRGCGCEDGSCPSLWSGRVGGEALHQPRAPSGSFVIFYSPSLSSKLELVEIKNPEMLRIRGCCSEDGS